MAALSDLAGTRRLTGLLPLLLAGGLAPTPAPADGPLTEQKRVIAAIRDDGGQVERDEARPGRPVIVVRLGGLRVEDASLAQLKVFPALRELSFSSYSVTDAGLAHLEGFSELEILR